ncbi:MAG: lamin tail domain-containing protein [bacterium]|nr:lamin tail domain-containing protein [bacterium]
MLASLATLAVLALPQNGEADPPVGLTVVLVDVGQGDGVVIRAPNGTIHCLDGGPNGQGSSSVNPVIAQLQPTGYGFTFLTHFHDDHQGGLDELLITRPFQFAYDRGDLRRTSQSPNMANYLNAAGSRRRTAVVGGVYPLGGGATLTCLTRDGNVLGGAFVNPTSSAQEENSRSLAFRLDYGDFSMWLGGDLTGGGNNTSDVESPASLACGDVDVYMLNHHGSNTSSSTNLITRLDPELCVVSCGTGNPYGHPTITVTNRIVQAAATRAMLSTTRGSSNTIGFGVTGNIRIDTDGRRYRASAENGDFLDFYCDEVTVPTPTVGDLKISELHRDPSVVPDTNGEYIEVVNIGSKPVGLMGLRIQDNSSSITLASNFMLVPGRPMVFQRDGAPTRNGNQPLGMTVPYNTMTLGNGGETIQLRHGSQLLDSVAYTSSWPGGSGTAAERRDLRGANFSTNWTSAPLSFGNGDRGSPGAINPTDTTVHPVEVCVTTDSDGITVHGTALDHGGGARWSVLGVAYGSVPGFPFLNATVPLNLDPFLQLWLGVPGAFQAMPAAGYRSMRLDLPTPNVFTGATLYAAHVIVDLNTFTIPALSTAMPFQMP